MRRTTPLLLLATLLSTASAASARFGMPEPLTSRGATMESIYFRIVMAGLFFFFVVMIGMAWVLIRYREGSGHGRPTHEKHRHSTAAEVTWTVVPLAVVLWIGYIAYVGLVDLDEAVLGEHDMEIKITASQWNWEAVYPEGFSVFASPDSMTGNVSEDNHFLVPAGVPILLNITSVDVIHALHLMDANRMTVALVDANPLGDHKYNLIGLTLEEGDYPVQCREMCFNPGHAYMRAHFRAVPAAEYDVWAQQKAACAGVAVCLTQEMAIGAGGLSDPANTTGVVDSRYVLRFTNELDRQVTVEAPGADPVQVAAGRTGLVSFDLAEQGNVTLRVSDESRVVAQKQYQAVVAERMEVVMGAFEFIPDRLDLQAGVTYFVSLDNQHTAPHNLYIGDHASGTVLHRSPDIPGGASGGMLITVDETGPYDIWCNIAGHYDLGMYGQAHVHA